MLQRTQPKYNYTMSKRMQKNAFSAKTWSYTNAVYREESL